MKQKHNYNTSNIILNSIQLQIMNEIIFYLHDTTINLISLLYQSICSTNHGLCSKRCDEFVSYEHWYRVEYNKLLCSAEHNVWKYLINQAQNVF